VAFNWGIVTSTRLDCEVIVGGKLPSIAGAEGVRAAKHVKSLGYVALEALGLGSRMARSSQSLRIKDPRCVGK